MAQPAQVRSPAQTIRELYEAASDKIEFERKKAEFERRNGRVVDAYFATTAKAGVAVVELRKFSPWYSRYEIRMFSDDSADYLEFSQLLRDVRTIEGQSSPLLRKRSQHDLVLRLFNLISDLLNSLDSAKRDMVDGPLSAAEANRKLNHEVAARARGELDQIKEFAREAARASSLSWYLLGLPLGLLVGGVLIFLLREFPNVLVQDDQGDVGQQIAICLAAGAIGAVISVMTRITRAQKVEVDINQGRPLTMAAGGFRTIIGSIFGAVLYVLVLGDLLPLKVPGGQNQEVLFFAGLAFIAGFSERWAQDTVVHSVPQLGRTPPSAPPPEHSDDESPRS